MLNLIRTGPIWRHTQPCRPFEDGRVARVVGSAVNSVLILRLDLFRLAIKRAIMDVLASGELEVGDVAVLGLLDLGGDEDIGRVAVALDLPCVTDKCVAVLLADEFAIVVVEKGAFLPHRSFCEIEVSVS
jgi:hypothetical protein